MDLTFLNHQVLLWEKPLILCLFKINQKLKNVVMDCGSNEGEKCNYFNLEY